MINTVDEYINFFDNEIKVKLILFRKIIKETAPEATEKIAWGVPTYMQNGFLVQFAACKKHIGFYSSPATINRFKDELINYKTNNKNTVQFLYKNELPVALIKKMILFRIEENNQ